MTQAGHSIGQVAQLPMETLRQLAAESFNAPPRATCDVTEATSHDAFLDQCLAATKALDARALEDGLQRGSPALGALGFKTRL